MHGDWERWGSEFPDILQNRWIAAFRMSKPVFYALYWKINHMIDPVEGTRAENCKRKPIPGDKRLAICLSWLATGSTYFTVGLLYRVAKATVRKYAHLCVEAINSVLYPEMFRAPSLDQLQDIAAGFYQASGLKNCMGAIDGTFMMIRRPQAKDYGAMYYCYKKYYGILLLGICDTRKRLWYFQAGLPGCVGDAYAWNNSVFNDRFHRDEVWQKEAEVVGGVTVRPYIVADAAFRLTDRVMKGYESQNTQEEAHFCKAIIHARRFIENAWAEMIGAWRVLRKNHLGDPPKWATEVAKACAALHNWRIDHREQYKPAVMGDLPEVHSSANGERGRGEAASALAVRNALAAHAARVNRAKIVFAARTSN